ncbi:MAG: DUF4118 domain-containing protein [Chloroflexota bacterium]
MARKIALDLTLSLAIVAATTLLIGWILSASSLGQLPLLYILGILWLATARGRTAAILASVEAFLLSDWFFVPPYHTLDVEVPQEWLSLGIFLLVALTVAEAYAQQRRQADEAAERERHTDLLYTLSTELTAGQNLGAIFDPMLEMLAEGLRLAGLRLYISRGGVRELVSAVDAAHDGLTLPVGAVYRIPCKIGDVELAEIEAFQRLDGEPPSQDEKRVLQGFANQLANALRLRKLEKEEQLNRLLEESDRAKSGLLAAVSHDLRTPLAAIKASATGLLQARPEWDEAARREFATSISTEADRLNRLVANLLDMSRIEAGVLKPRKEWHSLAEIAADAVDRLQPVSGGHELRLLAPEPDALCQVDYVQMLQVLTNLLDNAIRCGTRGTPIVIRVSGWSVRVENAGAPLGDAERERIFDRFYRAPGQVSGTGLGLAIARGVMEAHGGTIAVKNTATGVAFEARLQPELQAPADVPGLVPPALTPIGTPRPL